MRLNLDLPDLELRAEPDGDGRTLYGRILPYGEVIEINGGKETFEPGVFSDTDPESVLLLWQHDPAQPIGRATELEDVREGDAPGYYGTFRVADTTTARDALSLLKDGIIRGLSVGIVPGQTSNRKGVRVHRQARLVETSVVTFAAYNGAEALAVRKEEPMEDTAPDVLEPLELVADPVDLSGIETRLDTQATELREVRNQIANIVLTEPQVEPPMSVYAAFAELLKMVADNPGENRALADVVGTAPGNASALIRDQWISEVVGYINALRPLFSAAGTIPFPSSGYGIAFPRITQHTTVAKRGAEKSPIPTRELILDAGNFPMEWFAGGVDVALELISQSDPSVREVVVGSLMDQYAVATETEFAADTVAGATVGGATLPVSDWDGFVGAVVATSGEIRTATGVPGDRLALTTASWLSLVGMLNPSQPATAVGVGPDFTAEAVNVGGITAFHAPYLTADVQFNTKSLRNAERAPDTVTATNVALMGQDIGILGATIFAPFYPAGIVKYTATAGTQAASSSKK